ncbi:MAG: DNA-protecting protein DprA [Candidatus Riflebacteria bacterium]|nr:DNA-protecting protein DprA [Candidatus Riflebacteria bacterium]
MQDKRIPWLKLLQTASLGPTLLAGLIKYAKTPERALSCSKDELLAIPGWDNRRAEKFIKIAAEAKPACSPEKLDQENIKLIDFNHRDYPPYLREIPDSPLILFAKGKVIDFTHPSIAIVGARQASQTGYEIAKDFAEELAKAGFNIISGLALGIDTYAHLGALAAGKPTYAVLANGVDVIYPRSNQRVRSSIIEKGALLSENLPGETPRPWSFPIRNRIISGISIATLVIEASNRSGSLITARLAAEQNREVFAVPGSIKSVNSQGTLNLIKEGAFLVTDPQDIIDYYKDILPEQKIELEQTEGYALNKEEIKLLEQLSAQPLHLDKLIDAGWERDLLFPLLLELEMRNYLVKYGDNTYQTTYKYTKGRQ